MVVTPVTTNKRGISEIKKRGIKNQVAQTDSALNTDQILSKNHSNLMLPDRVIATPSSQKVLTKGDINILHEFYLHSSNSVRIHWIIIALLPFLISIR